MDFTRCAGFRPRLYRKTKLCSNRFTLRDLFAFTHSIPEHFVQQKLPTGIERSCLLFVEKRKNRAIFDCDSLVMLTYVTPTSKQSKHLRFPLATSSRRMSLFSALDLFMVHSHDCFCSLNFLRCKFCNF